MSEEIVCFVCKKPIKENENPVKVGHDKVRHNDCGPGSKNWKESDVGKKSTLSEFYPKEEENASDGP